MNVALNEALGNQGGWSAKATCILNCQAHSNQARDVRYRLEVLFKQHGFPVKVIECERGSDAPDLARKAVADGSQIIIAGGGDGSINAVASAVVGSSAALGVLPLGTLNHFAKDMGIPLELEDAVATIVSGKTARVDVGEVNGLIFLNNSSLGLYPAIVQEREKAQSRGQGKWPAFLKAVLYVFSRYSHMSVNICAGGTPGLSERTPFVFIGNNQYSSSGLSIGKRDRLDTGRLWVYRAPDAGRFALLRLALAALVGKPNPRELRVLDTENVLIAAHGGNLRVAVDGEIQALKSPLRYRVLPKALNVIVPKTANAVGGSPV
jgi:diacylglycerol kinase family enzyme